MPDERFAKFPAPRSKRVWDSHSPDDVGGLPKRRLRTAPHISTEQATVDTGVVRSSDAEAGGRAEALFAQPGKSGVAVSPPATEDAARRNAAVEIQKVVRGFLQRGGTVHPMQIASRLRAVRQLHKFGRIDRRCVNEMGFHEIRGPSGVPLAFMQQDAVLKAATDTEPEQRGIRFIPNPQTKIESKDRRRGEFWETSSTYEARGPSKPLISQRATGRFQAPLKPEMQTLLRSFKSFVVPERVRVNLAIAEKMQGSVLDHLEAGGAAFSMSDFKDLAKDLKGFHVAGGLHFDIHIRNILVHPRSGLRLADFDGAVFRNDIKDEPTIDFAAVDAETEGLQNDERLIEHLRHYGRAIDEFMLLRALARGLGEDERDLDIMCLNSYAQHERDGESLREDDAEDKVEATVNLGVWLATVAKPEHVEDIMSLVLNPIGFHQQNPDRHYLYDMLNFVPPQQ